MRAIKGRIGGRGRHMAAETGSATAGLAVGDPLSAFRAAVMRRSVPVLFAAVAALAVVAAADGIRLDAASAAFLGTTLAGLGLATRVPWERAATSPESWAAWLWSVIMALVLGGLALVPGLAASTRPLLAAVVVMTGLVLTPVRHASVTILTLALVAASYAARTGFTVGDMAGPLVIVAVTSLAVGFAARQLEQTATSDRQHVMMLTEERAAYQRLYALASTLGAASSAEATLPILLKRLASYLDSGTGAWLVADEHSGMLGVASTVVIDGVARELDETLEVRMRGSSFVARALRSERPISLRVEGSRPERNGILGKLGVDVALAAPLVVDGQRVGVVLVGDPAKGHYEPRDIDEIAVLSAPAGLVLAQLRRQREAAELTDRLREVAQMKTDFVSIVSHELRTPLTSIRGALDTLARPGLVDENTIVSELVGSARRQTNRLERLINDLLVASRLDRGTMRSVLVPVSVAPIVEEVVGLVAHDRIRVDVSPTDVIPADPDQFTQVVRNLIENAVKYGAGTDIEVAMTREPGGLTLVVADHGPGILPADRARIFDRFVQLERPDRRSNEGSGLGLSIVKSLVDSMGGRIKVTETPGGGTTFLVSFRSPSALDLSPLASASVY